MTSYRVSFCLAISGWLFLLAAFAALPAVAQPQAPLRSDSVTVAADTLVHPNDVPYETDYGWGHHLLSLPSYAWHALTRPIGWAIVYAEDSGLLEGSRRLLFDKDAPVSINPLISFGGPTYVSGGLGITWRDPFGWEDHQVQGSFRYGGPGRVKATAKYDLSHAFGPNAYGALAGVFERDAANNLFLGGNDASLENEASYALEREQVRVLLGADPQLRVHPTSRFGWSAMAGYRRVVISESDADVPRRLPINLPGRGSEHYATLGIGLTADAGERLFFRRAQRYVAGSRVRLGYDFNAALNDNASSYHGFVGEWVQYIPIPVLAPARRLSFGARLEKRESIAADGEVPFYAQSVLGNAHSLRGYAYQRFRDEGAVSLSLQYEYPVWDALDVALFVDGGQVFEEFADVAVDGFHWSYGVGMYLYGIRGLTLRVELGFTPEGMGFQTRTEDLFDRTARLDRDIR